MLVPFLISISLAYVNAVVSSGAGSRSCSASPLSLACLGPEMLHLGSICEPGADNEAFLSFPCNQKALIWLQCYYGRTFHQVWNTTTNEYISEQGWTSQSPEKQRLCTCESEYFETLTGCSACYEAHGSNAALFQGQDGIKSMSSSYCAATSTPTVGIQGMVESWYNRSQVTSAFKSAVAEAITSTYSDPLSGSTAVSLYFTPRLTGSAVFNIAGVTQGATPTTTHIAHGQITNGASYTADGMALAKVAMGAVLAFFASIALL